MRRDPRIDPRAGDVLKFAESHHFIEENEVEVMWTDRGVCFLEPRILYLSIERWRERMAHAEIVKVAE